VGGPGVCPQPEPSKPSEWHGSTFNIIVASVMCITVDRRPGSYIWLSTLPSWFMKELS